MNNLVAIVGRPNAGKSSLFNTIVGKRKSIVHDQKGTTRDRLYSFANWSGVKFKVIDTGGIEIENKSFQEQIKIQALVAIEEASVIILVLDGVEGLTSDDEFIMNILRKSNKPILVAANKLEGKKKFNFEIYSLGFKDVFLISAIHGNGIGDLLDKTISFLDSKEGDNNKIPKLSIIGRPNAGKSSLLNILLGSKRSIISSIPGTTRDSVDALIKIDNENFQIFDTAGINKKSKLVDSIEHYALSRAMNAIVESNIIILLIDNEKEISHFDLVLAGYAYKRLKPMIIAINKWDLAKKETMTMKNKEKEIRKKFKFLSWTPIVFISAKTKLRINKLEKEIINVNNNRLKEIKTNVLNDVITEVQIIQPAQPHNGRRLNIKFVKQVKNDIPKFIFWVNNKKYLHFSYERFIENKIREYFGFKGTPIKFIFKNKKEMDYEK